MKVATLGRHHRIEGHTEGTGEYFLPSWVHYQHKHVRKFHSLSAIEFSRKLANDFYSNNHSLLYICNFNNDLLQCAHLSLATTDEIIGKYSNGFL